MHGEALTTCTNVSLPKHRSHTAAGSIHILPPARQHTLPLSPPTHHQSPSNNCTHLYVLYRWLSSCLCPQHSLNVLRQQLHLHKRNRLLVSCCHCCCQAVDVVN